MTDVLDSDQNSKEISWWFRKLGQVDPQLCVDEDRNEDENQEIKKQHDDHAEVPNELK